jgi:hypothetical protein
MEILLILAMIPASFVPWLLLIEDYEDFDDWYGGQ